MGTVTIDVVTQSADRSTWRLVLVEQGPWSADEVEVNLRRLQDRLYGCLDAALDGRIAERFPESAGHRLVVRLDAYNVPEQAVREFFERFSGQVLQVADYKTSLASTSFVSGIDFELNVEQLPRVCS